MTGRSGTPARRQAERRGRTAESLALLWLRCKGYRAVARGWRVPQGQIDLIVARGGDLAFVEVKRRDDLAGGLGAVSPQQRRRITAAARAFLLAHPRWARRRLRFDVVVIRPWRLPMHLPNAFAALP